MKNVLIFGALTLMLVWQSTALLIIPGQNGYRYFVETSKEYNWHEAVHECARRNASLVSIETEEKQYEISAMLSASLEVEELKALGVWTAGHDNAEQGSYNWITSGQRLQYTNWAVNEPNNDGGNEHCLMLISNTMQWNDVPCSIDLGYVCQENQLLKHSELRCDKLLELVHQTHNQTLDETQLKVNELRVANENLTNILLQTQKQELELKSKEVENLKQSHKEELDSINQKHIDELEAIRKFHVHIIDTNKLEMETLKKSHENTTNLLLQANQEEIENLKDSNAVELVTILESAEKSCENKTLLLIEQKIEEFMEQKNKEIEELKEMYEKEKEEQILSLKKIHENELNQLQQEKEQKLENLHNDCNDTHNHLTIVKNAEIATLQKVNELEVSPTMSYKFYNFVFHGNNNNKN